MLIVVFCIAQPVVCFLNVSSCGLITSSFGRESRFLCYRVLVYLLFLFEGVHLSLVTWEMLRYFNDALPRHSIKQLQNSHNKTSPSRCNAPLQVDLLEPDIYRVKLGFTVVLFNSSPCGIVKVRSVQRPGTEAIGTQIQPSRPKREMTYIIKSQNTKENIWSAELAANSQKVAIQQQNKNSMNTHRVKRHRSSDNKTDNREPQRNYRLGTVSNELLGVLN